MLNLTHEHIISAKADCFRAGIFDVLDLTAKQVAAMAVLTDQETDELLFGGAAGGGGRDRSTRQPREAVRHCRPGRLPRQLGPAGAQHDAGPRHAQVASNRSVAKAR